MVMKFLNRIIRPSNNNNIDNNKYLWALSEMSPWINVNVDKLAYEKYCHEVNKSQDDIIIYQFDDSGVMYLRKYDNIEITLNSTITERREIYLNLFRQVISEKKSDLDFIIAVCVGDRDPVPSEYPIFSFQKSTPSKSILLPDPDFYYYNYYMFDFHQDNILFHDKLDRAIFVGRTTGKGDISISDINTGLIPRINSAMNFKDKENIEFYLTDAVQCKNDQVVDYIHSLGIIHPFSDTWPEQFKRKYIISMDGNGACCSRICLTLKSNSILLKYNSSSQLYYYKHLEPWIHYIPINNDSDVQNVFDYSSKFDLEKISENARLFYYNNLQKSHVYEYTYSLLNIFNQILQ